MSKLIIFSLTFLIAATAMAQPTSKASDTSHSKTNEWYKRITLKGFAQMRYNHLLETNPNLKNEAGDKTWGGTGGLSIRRARLKFSGALSDRVYMAIETDLNSTVSSSINNTNFLQIRDCYFDLSLDKKSEYRLRIGQSKVPYGFENMQSDQTRLAIDRTDGINSGVPNEFDMGVFGYWAPTRIRERFAFLANSTYKGSGDFGVIGLGVYNGQSANRVEANNNLHMVVHAAYPFLLMKKQYIEIGAHAYNGIFTVTKNAKTKGPTDFKDQRICGSFVVYPQPFGFQAEYNVGKGPEFHPADSSIRLSKLNGGYAQIMYLEKIKGESIIPFVRYHFYNGGKKAETDARSYTVNDLEIGVEWQPLVNFEFTADYTISQRRFEDFDHPVNVQKGNLLRLQAQFNF